MLGMPLPPDFVVFSYLISFLFIRLMLRTKKMGVTAAIQTRLMSSDDSRFPIIRPLERSTTWVRGRNAFAKTCMDSGRLASGKNVPLSRNMGVMNRKPG